VARPGAMGSRCSQRSGWARHAGARDAHSQMPCPVAREGGRSKDHRLSPTPTNH
jgi:hypothetical protein